MSMSKKRRVDLTAEKKVLLINSNEKDSGHLPGSNVQFTGNRFASINNSMVLLTPEGNKS